MVEFIVSGCTAFRRRRFGLGTESFQISAVEYNDSFEQTAADARHSVSQGGGCWRDGPHVSLYYYLACFFHFAYTVRAWRPDLGLFSWRQVGTRNWTFLWPQVLWTPSHGRKIGSGGSLLGGVYESERRSQFFGNILWDQKTEIFRSTWEVCCFFGDAFIYFRFARQFSVLGFLVLMNVHYCHDMFGCLVLWYSGYYHIIW